MKSTAEGQTRTSKKTWWMCWFLFLGTALIYLDRTILALTAEKIIHDFGLSSEGLGHVIGAFRYSYGIFQILGGFLVDAHGARIVFPAASGLWSLAGLLTGLASTVTMLMGFRMMLGVGEAFNWPCATRVTQDLVPSQDRPLAIGLFSSGAPVGALLAPIVVTTVTIFYSWRAAFVITGTLGGLWVLGWLGLTRGSEKELSGIPIPGSEILTITIKILRLRGFWILMGSAIIINGVTYYLADWMPLYLKTTRGFSFVEGNMLSIAIYAGSSAGNILTGLFVRKLVHLGLSLKAAKKLTLIVSCFLMLTTVFAGFTPYRYLAFGCLILTSIGSAGFSVIYTALGQDLCPAYVGVVAGFLGGAGNLAYGYLSPYIGLLADLHKNFLTLTLIGVLPWFALAPILWGFKEFDRSQ